MPGPLDFLTRSLIPKRAIQGAQDYLDPEGQDTEGGILEGLGAIPDVARGLVNNPRETLGGLGAGVLEGARQQVNPLSLASLASIGGIGGVGRFMGGRGGAAAGKTLDLIDDVPVKQIMPSVDDVGALTGDLRRNLARIPNARPKPVGVIDDAGRELAGPQSQGVAERFRPNMRDPRINPVDPMDELLQRLGGRGPLGALRNQR